MTKKSNLQSTAQNYPLGQKVFIVKMKKVAKPVGYFKTRASEKKRAQKKNRSFFEKKGRPQKKKVQRNSFPFEIKGTTD